jgi:hypothetical protein
MSTSSEMCTDRRKERPQEGRGKFSVLLIVPDSSEAYLRDLGPPRVIICSDGQI